MTGSLPGWMDTIRPGFFACDFSVGQPEKCTFVNDVRLKKHERVFGYHNGFADGKRA